MKNILIPIILSLSCTCVYSNTNGMAHGGNNHDRLPLPNSGIQIIPHKEFPQIGNPNINSIKNFNEQKEIGYIKSYSQDAKHLLAIKENKILFADNNNFHDTHMKLKLEQMKIAFNFNPISFINTNNVIGYAVAGSWTNNGWTGVGEIFTISEVGRCSYVKNNVKLSNGGVILDQDLVTYDVNTKPTIIETKGEERDGYSYTVRWYDENYYHTLICASKTFSKDKSLATLELAKKIDMDQA